MGITRRKFQTVPIAHCQETRLVKVKLCLIIASSRYRQLLSQCCYHFLQTHNLALSFAFLFLSCSDHFTILHYLLTQSIYLFFHLQYSVFALFEFTFQLLNPLLSFRNHLRNLSHALLKLYKHLSLLSKLVFKSNDLFF